MSTKIETHAAYVLHTRNYRDSSLIVEFFTHNHGRLTTVARGARNVRAQLKKGMLQAFAPMHISCYGQSELQTLTHMDIQTQQTLPGVALFCGLYLNELLLKLLAKQDPHPELFAYYAQTITHLSQAKAGDIAKYLRLFEKKLLSELGYAFQVEACQAQAYYRYTTDEGFQCVDDLMRFEKLAKDVFYGAQLQKIYNEEFHSLEVLSDAKRLFRLAIDDLLDGKVLNSRQVYMAMLTEMD